MSPILILTAGYGEGHNAAARGLHAACQQLGIPSEVHDPCEAMGATYQRSRDNYIWMINHAPLVWASVFNMIHYLPLVEMTIPFTRPVHAQMAALIDRLKPCAVVSVYPAYTYFYQHLYPKQRPCPFYTIVTDSISVNRVWLRALSELYFVPNEATAEVIHKLGIGPELTQTAGFPVSPRFGQDRPERPDPSEGPRVLFMINAGKQLAPSIVDRVLKIPKVHLTVTVGRDEKLRQAVEKAAAGRPLEIHGWTQQMPELLMSHHVMIGKAGGAAVQETIAAQTPMIITQVVPGQEQGNADLLMGQGCGALCPTAEGIGQKLEALFANDAREWREWHAKICEISRPDAALRIARFIADKHGSPAPAAATT